MKKEMLINCLQAEETRIAILEDGILQELYVERQSVEGFVGNVYKGKIVNIEPSIQAAFVDFGVGRNGFLHISDVDPVYYEAKGVDTLTQPRGVVQGRPPRGDRRDRRPRDEDFDEATDLEDDSDDDLPVKPVRSSRYRDDDDDRDEPRRAPAKRYEESRDDERPRRDARSGASRGDEHDDDEPDDRPRSKGRGESYRDRDRERGARGEREPRHEADDRPRGRSRSKPEREVEIVDDDRSSDRDRVERDRPVRERGDRDRDRSEREPRSKREDRPARTDDRDQDADKKRDQGRPPSKRGREPMKTELMRPAKQLNQRSEPERVDPKRAPPTNKPQLPDVDELQLEHFVDMHETLVDQEPVINDLVDEPIDNDLRNEVTTEFGVDDSFGEGLVDSHEAEEFFEEVHDDFAEDEDVSEATEESPAKADVDSDHDDEEDDEFGSFGSGLIDDEEPPHKPGAYRSTGPDDEPFGDGLFEDDAPAARSYRDELENSPLDAETHFDDEPSMFDPISDSDVQDDVDDHEPENGVLPGGSSEEGQESRSKKRRRRRRRRGKGGDRDETNAAAAPASESVPDHFEMEEEIPAWTDDFVDPPTHVLNEDADLSFDFEDDDLSGPPAPQPPRVSPKRGPQHRDNPRPVNKPRDARPEPTREPVRDAQNSGRNQGRHQDRQPAQDREERSSRPERQDRPRKDNRPVDEPGRKRPAPPVAERSDRDSRDDDRPATRRHEPRRDRPADRDDEREQPTRRGQPVSRSYDDDEPSEFTARDSRRGQRRPAEPNDDFDDESPRQRGTEYDARKREREPVRARDDREDDFFDDDEDSDHGDDDFQEPRREGGRSGRPGGRGGRDGGRRGGYNNDRRRPKVRPPIQEVFRRGQEVIVQVIKEGLGNKGPTLSTYISIPGRYLVLMPGMSKVGVSRKIEDDNQRRRLRDILMEVDRPEGIGFIVRTAGQERSRKELEGDLTYLGKLWESVIKRVKGQRGPGQVYHDSDMIIRTIRDIFNSEIDTIYIDEPEAFEKCREFLQMVMPKYADRLKLYEKPAPIFHHFGIEDEISQIQKRQVALPNGGSIVIDQTEALVAIDVNSGNFRTSLGDAEETAFQMNLQAAREIARQLRLRDLGGVIVIDFIDMRDERHRRAVEHELREAVKRDRARTKILRMSAFCMVEMTRQRIRPSLRRSLYRECPTCRGTSQVKTPETLMIDCIRMLTYVAQVPNVKRVEVRVDPEVGNALLNQKRMELAEIETHNHVKVSVIGVHATTPETLEIHCFDEQSRPVEIEMRSAPAPTPPPKRRGPHRH